MIASIAIASVIQQPKIVDFEYAKFMRSEIHCLAENAYFEARNQTTKGQLAVLLVTHNRAVKSKQTYCQVVYAPKQFSWTINKPTVTDQQAWKHSSEIAAHFYYNKRHIKDVTKGATFYHATYVKPVWAKFYHKVAKIDQHVFYVRLTKLV